MKVMVTGRGGGKTAAMLQWMREAPEGEHRVCVTVSRQEAMRLLRENRDLESWQFVSSDEVTRSGSFSGVLHGRSGRVVLGVDNADMLLERLLYWPVGAVTLTEDSGWSAVGSAVSDPSDPLD